jgi:hypothetical protein
MTPTPDQHPIQTLLPHRPHPALGERVGVRRLNRGLDDLDAVSGQDIVEGAGELGIPVTKEEPRAVVPSGRPISIESSRARWTTQALFGWSVTPATRTCRVCSSMKNKTDRVLRRTVSTVNKSVAMMPAAWARRNARQVTEARRGAGRSPLPSSTARDRGGCYADAELLESALDALVAQREFSLASRRISATSWSSSGGRPPRLSGWVHLRVTSRRCHRRIVSGVTRKIDQRRRGSALLSTASSARSAGWNSGRLTWRRSTRSWWRSTAISTSWRARCEGVRAACRQASLP